MSVLNKIQYQILGSLTFVEPLTTLIEEVPEPEPVIVAELRDLIDQRLVQVMAPVEGKDTFEKSFYYDADDMRAFSYVATSSGIEQHDAY